MNRRRESRRRGFTLIELLVVVGVIAVLIAILLPSLAKAKETAKKVICQTRIRGWGQAFIMYTSDYNGELPLDGFDGTTGSPIGLWSDQFLWFNGLTKYVGTGNLTYDQLQQKMASPNSLKPILPQGSVNSIFMCPDAEEPGPGSGDLMTSPTAAPFPYAAGYFDVYGWDLITSALHHTVPRPMLICYGMNSQLRQWEAPYSSPDDYAYPGAPTTPSDAKASGSKYIPDLSKFNSIKPVSIVPLLAEKRINPNELATNDNNASKSLAQSKITANRFTARHNKGGNIVFADGHVEWFLNSVLNSGTGTNQNDAYNLPNQVIWSPFAPLGGSAGGS